MNKQLSLQMKKIFEIIINWIRRPGSSRNTAINLLCALLLIMFFSICGSMLPLLEFDFAVQYKVWRYTFIYDVVLIIPVLLLGRFSRYYLIMLWIVASTAVFCNQLFILKTGLPAGYDFYNIIYNTLAQDGKTQYFNSPLIVVTALLTTLIPLLVIITAYRFPIKYTHWNLIPAFVLLLPIFYSLILTKTIPSCLYFTCAANYPVKTGQEFPVRFWLHRANTLEMIKKYQSKYHGWEFDLNLDAENNCIMIGHSKPSTLTLEDLLNTFPAVRDNYFWLDCKGLRRENCQTYFKVLDRILERYQLRRNVIIESNDPVALQPFIDRGIRTSFWVPSSMVDPVSIHKMYAGLKIGSAWAVSNSTEFFPFLTRYYPVGNAIAWYDGDTSRIPRYLLNDSRLKVILIDEAESKIQ